MKAALTAGILALFSIAPAFAQTSGAPAAPPSPAVTPAEADTVVFDCPAFIKNGDGAWLVRNPTTARAGVGTAATTLALEPGQLIAARTTRINGIDLWELMNDRCR